MNDDATSALAASERRFRALIEHSGDGIAVIDADNRILYLSPGVTAVEGYTPEELVGRNGLENTHPDDLVLVEKVVAALVASPGRPVPVLWRRRHKDGRWLWLEGTATNLLHDPEVRGIVTNYRDVTERIASEEALRHSEAHLRTVVDNLGEGVAVSDLDGRLLEFNRAAVQMLGFSSPQEYLRRLPEFTDTFELASLDGQVLPLEQWPLSRILRGEDVSDLEVSLRRPKTGWQRIFSYGGALVRDEAGKPLLAILTMRDVTERKEAEWRIEAQVEHLSLLDQITRAIGQRQDLRSIFQVVVRSLEEGLPLDLCRVLLYDRVAGELRPAPLGSGEPAPAEQAPIPVDENGLSRCVGGVLVYEPDIGQTGVPFTQSMAQAGQRSMVLAPLRTQDEVLGVLVACRREPDAFTSVECEFLRQLGEHVGLAAQQSDLHSALQKAYDDLRRTQQAVIQQERLRALGEMASGIAHDINNAISPVSLYTESLLETEPGLSPRARGHLETIQRAVGDVAHTVARMREFYRNREAQLGLAPIEVNRLVDQVLDFTRARWSDMPQQRGVVIQAVTDLGPDLPKVMGIAGEIREALTNLVFNAVDAMPAGGTLTLRTRMVAGATGPTAVAIEVEDQGLGMDEDTRRRCLEPFFTTKGERGTGLGLPMVFGAAQRHGAELLIESTLGAGTTVRIVFPLAVASGPEAVEGDTQPRRLARLRLLVIDDDPVLLRALGEALETNGHRVATAGAGQAGIDAFAVAEDGGEPFDAVITDLGMPHVDGRRVAAAVKERAPGTPVLLLTGWGQRMAKDGDTPDHVDRVLSKPPKVRDILAALDQVLRPPQAPANP